MNEVTAANDAASPAQSASARLPRSVDVAVIGGGIIGMASAWALTQRGLRVAVFEKGALACEQSSRNWGWVRTLLRDPAEVPLAARSLALWRDIQARVDVGFRQSGILYLAKTSQHMREYASWLGRTRHLDARLLDGDAARALLPATDADWAGALYSARDGVAEPPLATDGIARLAREQGCQIFERCAVRGIQDDGGRAAAVLTEHGRVDAGAVLIAGGAWSRLLCGNLGLSIPQLKVRASVLNVSALPEPVDVAINGRDFTCRRCADGSYVVSQFNASYADIVPDSFRLLRHYLPAWIANNSLVKLRFGKRFFEELRMPRRFGAQAETPYERCRVLDPAPAPQAAMALRKLADAFPVFRQSVIRRSWAGYIDVMPDALPILSPVHRLPGLYIATGFSGHGFGIAPAVGEAMAALIEGKPPGVDLSAFRLGRF